MLHDYVQDKYDRRKRKKTFRIHVIAYSVLVVLLCTGVIYILRGDLYTVHAIIVQGDGIEKPIENDVLNIAWNYIEKRSWFASLFLNSQSVLGFSNHGLAENIASTYPSLAEITVSKNYIRRSITITGNLREKFSLWCTSDDQCRWFDRNGILFADAFSAQGKLINKIISPEHEVPPFGFRIPIDDQHIINDIFLFLNESGAPSKQLTWDPIHEELIASHAVDYPQILFSLRQDPLYALNEFKKIPHKEELSYIDLRITNRIFYK